LLLHQAIALDANAPTVRSKLGYFYLFKRGRKEDAKIQFEKALELSDGKDPLAWKGLGYLFKFEGQRKEALAAFRKYQSMLNGSDGEVSLAIEQLETEP
jgi:Tfp pilus assembly protein PilF